MIRSSNMASGNTVLTTLRSLVDALTHTMDLINEDVQDHHRKVAYLACRLAEEMGLSLYARHLAIYGGLLHDIGSIVERGSPSVLEIEARAGQVARAGAEILKLLPSTLPIAEVVGSTQEPYAEDLSHAEYIAHIPDAASLDVMYRDMDIESCVPGAPGGGEASGEASRTGPETEGTAETPRMIGQVVHLADVITLMFEEDAPVLNQLGRVRDTIRQVPEGYFHPLAVEAFERLCGREAVWMDLMYEPSAFLDFLPDNEYITLGQMAAISEFASVIIDFRSPFTAMHSAGVSATAVELAKRVGMSGEECLEMRIAANLHDLGKLRTPTEILEKPGKLTDEEFNIIKEHAYYTYQILGRVEGLDQIACWAAFHHEKLNGRGYPFHIGREEIHLGARILAVADIFSAITEDRPYRKGMEKAQVMEIMRENAARGDISEGIVQHLLDGYDEINEARARASRIAGARYYASMGSKEE